MPNVLKLLAGLWFKKLSKSSSKDELFKIQDNCRSYRVSDFVFRIDNALTDWNLLSMHLLLNIKSCSAFDPSVSSFIDALDKYQEGLYPSESSHLDSRASLNAANCCLLGCYKGNELVGIGAAKIVDGYGELKRFYIPESARGQGIGECLIATLERWLNKNGIATVYLETGIHQHAAIKFYEKLGYAKCSPFGNYKEDPLSVFMKKNISDSSFKSYEGPLYAVGIL